jgi:uncharacterized protein YbjT (DUF2867 family)
VPLRLKLHSRREAPTGEIRMTNKGTNMTLVVGATGMVGSEICRVLATSGKPVRAFVRATSNPSKVEHLKRLGATIVQGDLRDRPSLKAACQGVTAVICTASSIPFAYAPGENTPQSADEDGCLNLIDAAREAGVRQFVYTSFPPMLASFPLQDAKRAVEARLRSSGLTYTILQPTFFAEIWLSPAVGFDYANCKAAVYGTGDNAISWISFLDVAAFAVVCLDNPAARNLTLELGGPEGLSPREAVKIFEQAGGKTFDVTPVPVEALQGQLAGATDPMQKSFVGLMLGYAGATAIDMTAALRTFPLRLRTVEAYARGVLA